MSITEVQVSMIVLVAIFLLFATCLAAYMKDR